MPTWHRVRFELVFEILTSYLNEQFTYTTPRPPSQQKIISEEVLVSQNGSQKLGAPKKGSGLGRLKDFKNYRSNIILNYIVLGVGLAGPA